MIDHLQTLCQNRRQRRRSIEQAQMVLTRADDLLFVALVFVVFLHSLLLNPTLLYNLSDWLWWVRDFAWIGLLAWAVVRLLVAVSIAPAQITGATVEAMELATTDEDLVPFPPLPAEIECTLLPWRLLSKPGESKTSTQVQFYRQRLWRRPRSRLLYNAATRRIIPPSAPSPKPSA